jgi:hypothetical protein
MGMDTLIKQRFEELEKRADALLAGKKANSAGINYVDSAGFNAWGTSVLSLLEGVLGKDRIHYVQFRKHFENAQREGMPDYIVGDCKAVLQAAKEDYEGGYIFRLEQSLSGEILGDFCALAKAALRDGSKDVAAVLACAALEDALKRYAHRNGLEVDDKEMQAVVSALKSKSLVAGAQKQLLDTMPKLRDYAMHANWDKLTSADVGSIVGFVEQFLLSHF